MSRKRIVYLDAVRCVACLMVVAIHAPLTVGETQSHFLSALSYLSAPCIGMFFMVSGALLLPAKGSMSDFFRRRFTKILWPTVTWTLFYIAVGYFRGSIDNVPRALLESLLWPVSQGALWFMYSLIGLYLITPILSAWLERASKRGLQFYLGLWAVTLCLPVLSAVTGANLSGSYLFVYLSGYVGYFVLGYYLRRYGFPGGWRVLVPLVAVALAAPVVTALMHWQVDFYSVFWLLSVFVAVMGCAWFMGLRKVCASVDVQGRLARMLAGVSNLSFGIYLAHMFIIRQLLWNWPLIQNIGNLELRTLTIVALAFVSATALSWLISITPLGNYLIGYRRK